MPPSTPGRFAPGMIATYISTIDERADVGGQEAVERDAGGVRGQDLQVGDAPVRERHAQDRVPAERGQRGLRRLQRPARQQVAEPDPGQRVPQLREPAQDVDAEHLEDRQQHRDARQPRQRPWPAAAGASGRRTAATGDDETRLAPPAWTKTVSVTRPRATFPSEGMTRHHPFGATVSAARVATSWPRWSAGAATPDQRIAGASRRRDSYADRVLAFGHQLEVGDGGASAGARRAAGQRRPRRGRPPQ